MKIGRVLKLLSFFLAKYVSFFSCSRNHQNILVRFPKSTYEVKSNYVMFLALTFFIVSVFFRCFLKPSSGNEDFHTRFISFLSALEEYPLSYKVDEEMPYETYRFTNIIDETYSLAKIIEENDQEFIPRVVHLELVKGATRSHEDYKDFVPLSVHVELIEGSIRSNEEIEEFHGYDGYDEDNDDESDEDDVDSNCDDDGNDHDDLKIRTEEFIAKQIRKWKEEMLHDKFLYLEYTSKTD